MSNPHFGWSHNDEIKYLDGIGTDDHPRAEILPPVDRVVVLTGYLEGLKKRTNWDYIDCEKARAHAQQLLDAALAERQGLAA